ncbi:MAG TPA: nucleoside diphosphate kinase regulator [Candidatus Omnitrophota bacterium]|nr:nucleoside diphosphate kinase regulator [Candidatus Omnitrophota bacterium]HRZ14714.1 nucleoside diphosphate kinase regulator [Candidatus Omnitrophota bacterium]
MKDKKIYITRSDFYRLRETIKAMKSSREIDRRSLDELEHSFNSRNELRLLQEVRRINSSKNDAEWAPIIELEAELDRAIIVDADKIPSGVITMNSKVCLKDMDTGKDEFYQLVYPEDADIEQNKISVLAPIGTAILGYKVGDVIEWKVPAGLRRLKIKKILYQPETARDYYL